MQHHKNQQRLFNLRKTKNFTPGRLKGVGILHNLNFLYAKVNAFYEI
jgi:hypothetical protein